MNAAGMASLRLANWAAVYGAGAAAGDLHLHDGAGVGPESCQRRRRAAGACEVRIAGVVVIAIVVRRRGCWRIVVEDQRSAGERRKVNDGIGALGGHQQQSMSWTCW